MLFFHCFHFKDIPNSSRRLDQDEYICLSHTSSEDVLIKTYIFILIIPLQDVVKMSWERLQDIFKTSCQDVLKKSSKHLQDLLERSLQNIFKTFARRIIKFKLFLLTRPQDVINTFFRRTAKTNIYRKIHLGHTPEKFMVRVPNQRVDIPKPLKQFFENTLWCGCFRKQKILLLKAL